MVGLFNARGRCWHRAPKIALSSSGLRRPNLVNSESSGCPAPQASARHTRHILPRSTPPAPPRPTHTRTLPLTSQATPFPSPPAPPQRQSRDANRQSATNMQRKRPCIETETEALSTKARPRDVYRTQKATRRFGDRNGYVQTARPTAASAVAAPHAGRRAQRAGRR